MRYSNLSILLILLLLFQNFSTIEKGFKNQKNSFDEFLVEKIPTHNAPNYDELPTPNENKDTQQKQENNIKVLLQTIMVIPTKRIESDLEGSILSKLNK